MNSNYEKITLTVAYIIHRNQNLMK